MLYKDSSDFVDVKCILSYYADVEDLGPVVQSIVSLTSSLRGQLIKCFTTLLPNLLIFYVQKMRAAFALQKLLIFFSTRNNGIFKKLTSENLKKR